MISLLKCAIVKACIYDPVVQRAYPERAKGYSFKIDPCAPRDPRKKGVLEVKHAKGSFVPLREFRDLADLNAQAGTLLAMKEAGVRVQTA